MLRIIARDSRWLYGCANSILKLNGYMQSLIIMRSDTNTHNSNDSRPAVV